MVVECLTPCDECETGKGLRLELQGEVEVLFRSLGLLWVALKENSYLDDGVDTERNTT